VTDGKHTLERKFEEEVNRPPVKQREVSDILMDIKNHGGILKLFHLLKHTNDFNRLLFLHPLDLFGKEGRYRPPHLFHGCCPERKNGESYISRALRGLEIDYKAQAALGLNRILEQLGIEIQEEDAVGQDIVDAIVYVLVCFFRSSPKLLSLANSEKFDYNLLRKTLKDYGEFVDDEKLEEIISSILSEESSDPAVIDLLERLILIFTPLVTRDAFKFLDVTKVTQAEYAVAYHQAALSTLEILLEKSSLSFETYTDLMDQLYLFGLIENSHTILWCETCSTEKTNYYEFHGNMSPSKMVGKECRECGQKESFSSVYTVDPLLLESIFSRDGLLGVFLSWSLEDANLEYQTRHFAGTQEIDLLMDDILIECKTFRSGGREDTLRENLGQTLIQIQKQVKALEKGGHSVGRLIVLTNQPQMKNELQSMKADLLHNMIQYCIEIYGPDDMTDMIESFH